jgi:hypothetical protein
MPRARYGIDEALADIKRFHQEMQSQEIQSQIQRREMRPAWQSFALGFAIGTVCFAAAIASIKFLG